MIACFVLAAGTLCFAADDAVKPLVKGDNIVFFGDSITQGGSGANGYITLYTKAAQAAHPDFALTTVNAGISGHKVPNLQARIDKDVIAKKPTIVYIYIGINDVWHSEKGHGTSKEKYEAGLKELITKINAAGARVILCTPTVIGEKKAGANKLDAMLDEYSEISRKVAADTKTQLCDLRKAFQDYITANNPEDKEKGILTGDRVHLNAAGNKLVAQTMLKAVGEELK
ncbi:MAG TPA: G-D-S-L family lipolytic protein [Lentisphaeria bacterium]|nr:MAG: G-D-S-L family lipolytic protein [Lentisphaerae bacterium GWF2_50_93]HCE45514.1 G-D-S-L family lipolytic protein [Lentisphaeria bacterium]